MQHYHSWCITVFTLHCLLLAGWWQPCRWSAHIKLNTMLHILQLQCHYKQNNSINLPKCTPIKDINNGARPEPALNRQTIHGNIGRDSQEKWLVQSVCPLAKIRQAALRCWNHVLQANWIKCRQFGRVQHRPVSLCCTRLYTDTARLFWTSWTASGMW